MRGNMAACHASRLICFTVDWSLTIVVIVVVVVYTLRWTVGPTVSCKPTRPAHAVVLRPADAPPASREYRPILYVPALRVIPHIALSVTLPNHAQQADLSPTRPTSFIDAYKSLVYCGYYYHIYTVHVSQSQLISDHRRKYARYEFLRFYARQQELL